MRIHIAMILAATVAVAPVPAMAQDNQAATNAETANAATPAAADANMMGGDENSMGAEMSPPADTMMANDVAAMPAPPPPARPFPWGVIGLVGLIGLMGRRRG